MASKIESIPINLTKSSATTVQKKEQDISLQSGKKASLSPSKEVHWTMVIDLRKCIGCKACAVVCSMTNRVPLTTLRKVIDCGVLSAIDPRRIFVPMSCMHCGKPPCLEVCPTGATYRRPDGIVDIDEEKCLGCGYCQVACPYQARHILHSSLQSKICVIEYAGGSPVHTRQSGVSLKCNFCLPKIESGLARNQQPGRDADASPYCVISCSGGALYFGDRNDPNGIIFQLLRDNKTIRLQEEAGTEPSVDDIGVI